MPRWPKELLSCVLVVTGATIHRTVLWVGCRGICTGFGGLWIAGRNLCLSLCQNSLAEREGRPYNDLRQETILWHVIALPCDYNSA